MAGNYNFSEEKAPETDTGNGICYKRAENALAKNS
jgi:hypothetical protein